ERVGETEPLEPGHALAEPLHQPTRERAGGGDRDLLTEDGADSRLEAVPRPGRPQPRADAERAADDRVARKMTRGLVERELEVGDPPGPVDDVDELLPVRQVRAQHEVVAASREQLEHARVATDQDRAAVRTVGDGLD